MVEVAAGVYRSRVNGAEFEPDGEAGAGIFHHVFREDEAMQAGLYWAPLGPGKPDFFEFPQDESFLVIEGSVEIEIEGGPVLELQAGDMASIRRGVRCAWRERPGFKKFWVSS